MTLPHPSPYLLFCGIGFIVALFMLDASLKRRLGGLAGRAYCLFVFVTVIGWLGAHCLDAIVNHRSLTTAGFVFYGGLITGGIAFALLGTWSLSYRTMLASLNAAVVPLIVAHAFGRIGCLSAGCCYGKPIHGCPVFDRHPTQLYEGGFLGLLVMRLARTERQHPNFVLPLYLMSYSVFRFFIEFLRDDARGSAWGLSTSQIVSVAIFGLTAATVFDQRKRLLMPSTVAFAKVNHQNERKKRP
jgi:phosphatidylglycerol---prolipoprotein diacylglyceryl transferase